MLVANAQWKYRLIGYVSVVTLQYKKLYKNVFKVIIIGIQMYFHYNRLVLQNSCILFSKQNPWM